MVSDQGLDGHLNLGEAYTNRNVEPHRLAKLSDETVTFNGATHQRRGRYGTGSGLGRAAVFVTEWVCGGGEGLEGQSGRMGR